MWQHCGSIVAMNPNLELRNLGHAELIPWSHGDTVSQILI